jgi:hypothetical protein
VELLMAETLDLARAGPPGMAALVELATHIHLARLDVDDLEAAAASLDRLIRGMPRAMPGNSLLLGPSSPIGGTCRTPAIPQTVEAGSVVGRGRHASAWVLADGAIVYDHEQGVLARLDPNGAAVWGQLDGRHTLQDISAELNGDLDGIVGLLREMASAGLVDAVDAVDGEGGRRAT